MPFKWTPFRHVIDSMSVEANNIKSKVVISLLAEMHSINNKSLKRVPIDTTELMMSNRVDLEKIGRRFEARIVYDAPHAWFVENINKNYRNGRTWHYLRGPMDEALPNFNNRVAARARKNKSKRARRAR